MICRLTEALKKFKFTMAELRYRLMKQSKINLFSQKIILKKYFKDNMYIKFLLKK